MRQFQNALYDLFTAHWTTCKVLRSPFDVKEQKDAADFPHIVIEHGPDEIRGHAGKGKLYSGHNRIGNVYITAVVKRAADEDSFADSLEAAEILIEGVLQFLDTYSTDIASTGFSGISLMRPGANMLRPGIQVVAGVPCAIAQIQLSAEYEWSQGEINKYTIFPPK